LRWRRAYADGLASWRASVRIDLQAAGYYEYGSYTEIPTSDEFANMARILKDRVAELDELTAPEAGQDFHEEVHASIVLFGDLLSSIATDGYLTGQEYADRIANQDAKLREAAVQFEIECNIAVSDEDKDGVNEIGWGNKSST
jgi:hypothetical protein